MNTATTTMLVVLALAALAVPTATALDAQTTTDTPLDDTVLGTPDSCDMGNASPNGEANANPNACE